MGVRSAIGKMALGMGVVGLGALIRSRAQDDEYVDGIWETLERSRTRGDVFKEEMVEGLPEAARRYFLHAIKPGAPLASRLRWGYSAAMKPGREMPWMELRAEQILVKERGFVWKARAWKGPLAVTAADHFLDGEGRMKIALFGLIPVVNATGPDLSRSALARLVMEGVSLPSSFLPGPHVSIEGIDESRFKVTVSIHGETTPITLTVDPEGRVKEFALQRWGNLTEDGSYRYIPYGGAVGEERTFDGYAIPVQMAGGWWYGTDRYLEVIRMMVDWAHID